MQLSRFFVSAPSAVKTPASALALIAMIIAAEPAAAQATRPAKVFLPAIAEIQGNVQVPMLLPFTLPAVLRKRDISVARGTASNGGYAIELRYAGVDGNAGFAALFAGSKGTADVPHAQPGARRSRLANGIDAIFGPVSCGGSCAPANLLWNQNGVTYQIQIALRSDLTAADQERVLLAAANAMARVQAFPTASPARTVDTMRIGRAVNAWMQEHRAPALSVAIALDGQPAWSAGFGFADPARNVLATSRTSYRLASVTKSITATAVMMLNEQGVLDLDAPIQKYCPAYPAKRWPITARLLLAHLAGVRHHSLLETVRPNIRHFESVTSSLDRFKEPSAEVIRLARGTDAAKHVCDHLRRPTVRAIRARERESRALPPF